MQIIIAVAADLIIAVIALLAAGEFFGLKRFNSFTVPYTDKMIAKGIIPAEKRDAVLREDRMNHVVGMAISVLTCALMARFLAWPTGVAVFAVAFAAACIFTHPDMTETAATREGYFRLHKASMHLQRYAEMVQAMSDASEDDSTGDAP